MDLSTIYDWITSLLRPRAPTYSRTPSSCAHTSHCSNAKNATPATQTDVVVYSSAGRNVDVADAPASNNSQRPHLVYDDESTTINNIELIPTLQFVANPEPQDTYEQVQQCLRACCTSRIEASLPTQKQQEQRQQQTDVSATSSLLTFIVEKSSRTTTSSDSDEKELQQIQFQKQDLLATDTSPNYNFLQQEDDSLTSLTDIEAPGSLSTFFDEPTSSISIDIMESSQQTTSASKTTTDQTATATTTASTAATSSTSDHLPATSTKSLYNNTSQSYVPQSLTNPSSLSDEIEEEIEEAIDLSEDNEEQSLGSLPGPSQKQPIKTEQLFGIDISDISSAENSVALPESARSDQNSNQEGDQFKIDDDQLSGGKLAQHFVLNEEEEDTDNLSVSLPMEVPPKHSSHESDESFDVRHQQSLSNQSTSDDVSELHEESVEDIRDIVDSLQSDASEERSRERGGLEDSSVEHLLNKSNLSTPHKKEKDEKRSLKVESDQKLDLKDEPVKKMYKLIDNNTAQDTISESKENPSGPNFLTYINSNEITPTEPRESPKMSLEQKEVSESHVIQSLEALQPIERKNELQKSIWNPTQSAPSSRLNDDLSSIDDDSLLNFLESSRPKSKIVAESEVFRNPGKTIENIRSPQPQDEKSPSLILDEAVTKMDKYESIPNISNTQIASALESKTFIIDTSASIKPTGMKPQLPELFGNPNIKPLSGASSLHSDKDQSIEEIMASNHSLEIEFDDRNISSLNPSFIENNRTLISDLLKDSPRNSQETFAVAASNTENIQDKPTNLQSSVKETATISHQKEANKIPSIFPSIQYAAEYVEKTDYQQMESCGELLERTLRSEIVTDLDDSLSPTKFQDKTLQSLHVDIDFRKANERDEEEEEEDTSLQLMKLRILAMKHQPKESQLSPSGEATQGLEPSHSKPMERIPLTEFTKEVLEDITEESERNSLSTQEEQQSMNFEKTFMAALTSKLESSALQSETENSSTNSVVSLNMVQMLERKAVELPQMMASKDACSASLNTLIDNSHRRESNEHMGSGRDSSSIVTNSTEYRTLQEEFGQPTMDIYMELTKRDELIAKLTDSLQQSHTVRENLRSESDKLSIEVQLLRKQLTDAMETLKRPCWPKTDQESNFGQRISEISMDLVSESDDDFERHYLTDNEEKFSRNSRERQLSMPRQFEYPPSEGEILSETTPFSKQIEQFQKYLTPSEVRLFFMVQKKFDDYLCQELEKCKMKNDQEMKIVMDHWDTEKREKEEEIQRLVAHKQERESKHNQEMEDLRKYFETKCADLEKQFSDDVFSQKSQRQGMSSDSSDQEQLSDDFKVSLSRSKESSPRKRTRAELLLSPSHRQMTPGTETCNEEAHANEGSQLVAEITELRRFYQNKIHDIQRSHEANLKKLSDRLKYYESRYPEDEFMLPTKNSMLNSTGESSVSTGGDTTQLTVRSVNPLQSPPKATSNNPHDINDTSVASILSETLVASSASPLIGQSNNNNNNNTSLIIIDTDELNASNETQIIQKIIDEYERRLQEQLALAREDIVHELEQQIQTLLSETTADDQHWPKELILLREKFTAKSQLEIAQLQIKHAEEMSRLKLDHEKQLNRKNNRFLTFDSVREFDKLRSDRDNLRSLLKAFHQVLAELLKCVANCENDITETVMQEVQRLLSCNRTVEENALDDYSFNATLLNDNLSSTRTRLIPDVHSLIEVIEDPSLIEYIAQTKTDVEQEFDLMECVQKLRSEASYLVHLSEELATKPNESQKERQNSCSSQEKSDSCCEQEDGLKLQEKRTFIRVNSLNDQQLSTHKSMLITDTQNPMSLPPDLNCVYPDNNNTVELQFQLTELKNRLVKSENDRLKLQQELDNTISRNSDLGMELQHLRDQLSQLSSLNNVEYNEGYGLGSSLKTPPRIFTPDASAAGFAQLQEKARNILSTPTQKQQSNDSTVQLLQMIEDFCREGDKVVECSKKDREDLQSQIDTADKQLKATRHFLEEQAIEREQERDEFLTEIENLKAQIRDKEKERSTYANASEEKKHLELQIRDLTHDLQVSDEKRAKFEVELKASVDKIFVLREIISDLETQVETKALNEHVMGEKVKHLEDYINLQNRSHEALQMEVHSLKGDIEQGYQVRINQLEEKLRNIRPPAEQSMIMDQVVEQLQDIENTLVQKTKNLEALHQSASSSVASLSCPEDVSARGPGPNCIVASADTPSPHHPSPRQHSLTMEGVQRVAEKLSKHTRIEEAAVKRIRDLEMQVTQMRAACTELQFERESLQERMSEQTQRISALQSRLEEQRQRAEELQRANTTDLNIRIHDLQNDLQNTRETLSNRDKQIATMKQQLEKSKMVIDRLEAELAVYHEPDRSIVEKLETELKQKSMENQKLKDKIKNEMINKLSLPDLMETILAEKNEEIDHLKEQLDSKNKELKLVVDKSHSSERRPGDMSTKLGAHTFSDIASISELEEPDIVRRAIACNTTSPLVGSQASQGYLQNTMETSKDVVANLTHKRTEDLSGFTTLHHANTFDHPHYFQDPNVLQSGASSQPSPLAPRQINFSAMTEDSKFKTSSFQQTPENKTHLDNRATIDCLENEVKELRKQFDNLQKEDTDKIRKLQQEIADKAIEIDILRREQDRWQREKSEMLSKHEKNMKNFQESEESYKQRMHELEDKILKNTENEVNEKESLRKELRALHEVHEQCKHTVKDNESRKREIESLNQEIKQKDERLLTLSTKLSIAEDNIIDLHRQIVILERDVEKWKQQSSENSSRQFSVDEVAKQIEKELNYSAQLDSNILKAIESEEENNLDRSHATKNIKTEPPGTTDDENFTGERDLLNQLEVLKAQIAVERDHAEELRLELAQEKQHSQEVQDQDVGIIELMRKRLEVALLQEDELHKLLDMERERSERLQTQLTTLQRTESRRSSLLLKSPTESPRKSPRSFTDFESELAERLKSEIKLLTAQIERERERSADVHRNSERERARYEKELSERIDYCEKLKRETEKIARDKDNAEIEVEHLQERLMLQTQEIESLEARIASLQEAETRRCTRKEKHQKENAQLMAEVHELKTQLLSLETERESLNKNINQLRFDVQRSAQRESNLAEALGNANAQLAEHEGTATIPEQFLEKMKVLDQVLALNTQENKEMCETVQFLVEERGRLTQKCKDLQSQNNTAKVIESEERCNHLLGRYLRVESHRKALVYQKRYLKTALQCYQISEQRALETLNGGHLLQQQRPKAKLFKTAALAIIAIQRLKYIVRVWHTGKRIVSKSVFTITQQKRTPVPNINCPSASSNSPLPTTTETHLKKQILDRSFAPLKTPTLLNGIVRTPISAASAASPSSGTAFEWPSTSSNKI